MALPVAIAFLCGPPCLVTDRRRVAATSYRRVKKSDITLQAVGNVAQIADRLLPAGGPDHVCNQGEKSVQAAIAAR